MLLLSKKPHLVTDPELTAPPLCLCPVRPVPYHQQPGSNSAFQHLIEDLHNHRHPLHLAEIGDMHDHLLSVWADRLLEVLLITSFEPIQIDEVRDHPDILANIKRSEERRVGKACRYG